MSALTKPRTKTPRLALVTEEITWQNAIDDLIRQEYGTKENKTQLFYLRQLSLLARWAEAHDLSVTVFKARHLREYLAFRKESGLSERTIHHDAMCARVFARFCAREGYMPTNPLADYAIPRAERAYVHCPSEVQVQGLLRAIPRRWQPAENPDAKFTPREGRAFLSRRDYAIIAGLVDTGCRIGELLALNITDFDADRQQITIRRAKGNRPRILPVSEEWAQAVQMYLRVRPACASPLLFISRNGTPLLVSAFGGQFKRYLRFGGQEGWTLHGLRHYAVSIMSDLGGWEAARVMAGHSSVSITQQYVHQRAEQLRSHHDTAAPLARLLVNTRSAAQKNKRLK